MAKPIDYNKLNSAAKLIYDSMYGVGFAAGQDDKDAKHAKEVAGTVLRNAKRMIETAVKMQADDQIPNGYVGMIVSNAQAMLLTMCPAMDAHVYTITARLQAAGDLPGALRQIEEDLEALS